MEVLRRKNKWILLTPSRLCLLLNVPTKRNKAYSSYYCTCTQYLLLLIAALWFIPCCGHINNNGQHLFSSVLTQCSTCNQWIAGTCSTKFWCQFVHIHAQVSKLVDQYHFTHDLKCKFQQKIQSKWKKQILSLKKKKFPADSQKCQQFCFILYYYFTN